MLSAWMSRALVCLLMSFSTFSIQASPWIAPGDSKARFSLQKLADRGYVDRPVSTWPVMWGSFHNASSSDFENEWRTSGLAASYLAFERTQQASPGIRSELHLSGYTETTGISGFDRGNEGNTGVSVDVQWLGEGIAVGLKPAYVDQPDDSEELRLDGSYVAATGFNWVVGAGAIDRWWGPGWQSSLILSNNARPLPSVWINRNTVDAPDASWLKWLGPWDLVMLAGQYEHERAVPDAKFLGLRFTFRPVNGLDIAASRVIMYGGDGRPEGASTVWDALIGRDNSQDGVENDPGNQLGSIDIRYGFGVGDQSMGLYAQMVGEDEAGAFPGKKSWLFGLDWTSQLLGQDQQWFVEYINTLADDFLGDALPNITYEHFQYRSGYRYYGRSMGSSLDGDAEAITLGLFHFLEGGSNISLKATYAELNQDGGNRTVAPDPGVFYAVPAGNSNVGIIDAGFGSEFLAGWLDLKCQFMDTKINYISGYKDQWSLGADWTYRF